MNRKIKVIMIVSVMILCLVGYLIYDHMHQQAIRDSIQLEFVENKTIEYGQKVEAKDFIQSLQGEMKILSDIDSMKVGVQTLRIEVTKDKQSKEFTLDVEVKDTQAPEILLNKEKVTIDYDGQYQIADYIKSVKDVVDGDLEYMKDVQETQTGYYTYSGDVNTKKAGTYQVKIKAVDVNGNQTEKTIEIVVKEKAVEVQKPTTTQTPTTQKPQNNQTQNNQSSNQQTTSQPTYTADPNNRVIVVDPGHQGKGNSSKEAVGPGSSTMKAKVSTGATGVSSKIAESQINLEIGLKLRDELQARGYTVVMTRTSQNVNMSNQERAQVGNRHKAAAVIHLHCDSSTNSSAKGAHTIAIASNNPYCPELYSSSSQLAKKVISSYCATTGISSRGVSYRNDLTGLNWSEVPSIYIEMGFISNASEDQKLTDQSFQYQCAKGIANGLDAYFQ